MIESLLQVLAATFISCNFMGPTAGPHSYRELVASNLSFGMEASLHVLQVNHGIPQREPWEEEVTEGQQRHAAVGQWEGAAGTCKSPSCSSSNNNNINNSNSNNKDMLLWVSGRVQLGLAKVPAAAAAATTTTTTLTQQQQQQQQQQRHAAVGQWEGAVGTCKSPSCSSSNNNKKQQFW